MSKQYLIYKIHCKDDDIKEIYVGSTTNLCDRKYRHRNNCKNNLNPFYNLKVYKFIRDNGGMSNWDFQVLDTFDFIDRKSQFQKEQEYIKRFSPELNDKSAYTSEEEKKEAKKAYRQLPEIKAHEIKLQRVRNDRRKEMVKNNPELELFLKIKAKQVYDNNKEEILEKQKERRQDPKVKQQMYDYNRQEEVRKSKKEYNALQKTKDTKKAYADKDSTKQKIAEQQKQRWADPEKKKIMLEKQREYIKNLSPEEKLRRAEAQRMRKINRKLNVA